MRAIHTIALLPVITVLCWGQEEGARPKRIGVRAWRLAVVIPKRRAEPERRTGHGNKLALYGEINFPASPLREVSSSVTSATQNFASLYVTPGLRLKAFPKSRISPYLAIGGGYADYEQSTTEINGQPNPASRELARGVFDFGAGVDVRVWRWVALRGEARDFYSGSPDYNVASLSGGQHNVFTGGAIVLRWH
jgi:opacity protein-like surface antigen